MTINIDIQKKTQEILQRIRAIKEGIEPNFFLPVGSPTIAILRPVFRNKEDIFLLTKWRNKFTTSFLSEFIATESNTKLYLTENIGKSKNRVLFMITTLNKKTVGSIGIIINSECSVVEFDAVVRGEAAPRGLMTQGVYVIARWLQSQFLVKEFRVRVRSDNSALIFYKKLGFTEVKRVPTKKIQEGNKTVLIENLEPSSAINVVYLRMTNIPTI